MTISATISDDMANALVEAVRTLRENPHVERLPVGSRARKMIIDEILQDIAKRWAVDRKALADEIAAALSTS